MTLDVLFILIIAVIKNCVSLDLKFIESPDEF